jgi:hypothetical protein
VQQAAKIKQQMTGRHAWWFVRGAWWVVSLEADGTVIVPNGPPPRAASYSLN